MKTTTAGTTCLTEAEDHVAFAIMASASWQQLSRSNIETAEAQHLFFDEMPLPDDGFAFTLDELATLHFAALIFGDPEGCFSIEQGDAQDYARESGTVLVVVERWVTEQEDLGNVNQQRVLKDFLGGMMADIHQSLTDNLGQRWMRSVLMKQPPTSWDRKYKNIRGRRQQSLIAVNWGGAQGSE